MTKLTNAKCEEKNSKFKNGAKLKKTQNKTKLKRNKKLQNTKTFNVTKLKKLNVTKLKKKRDKPEKISKCDKTN